MPREHLKRGRRAEKIKRKRQDDSDGPQSAKRRKSKDVQDLSAGDADDITEDLDFAESQRNAEKDVLAGPPDRPFYGMLDDDEQEYFKRADDMLDVNHFADAEERGIFIQNLHKEIEGKELKLACSQSCSRLLERLILLSGPAELKAIFMAFKANFLHLFQHRFASHCCETLFAQCAPVVTQEMGAGASLGGSDLNTMEILFLDVVDELSSNLGYLITDNFASHAFRVLLIVLSGQSLDGAATRSILQSKKKENVEVVRRIEATNHQSSPMRAIPGSFTVALNKTVKESIAGLDTSFLRALSTHPTGNPILQLLLRLELTGFNRKRAHSETSIVHRMLPDDPVTEGTASASFINGLVYDPIGSRLLEAIIEFAPAKMFKSLYRNLLKERLPSLARNEIAGYVVCRLLGRLSPEDLQAALGGIMPLIPSLTERGRVNVIKALVERSAVRKIDTQELVAVLRSAYAGQDGAFSIAKVLELPGNLAEGSQAANIRQEKSKTTTPRQNAAAGLLQSMLRVQGGLSNLVFESLYSLQSVYMQYLATTPALSPIVQIAITTPTATLNIRRKMITRLYGTLGQLSLSPSGSYVVDAIEAGSQKGLAFVRERVAEELAENEEEMRKSVTGRKVWRNWRMDLYQRNRSEWVHSTRKQVGNDGFQSLPGLLEETDKKAPVKTAQNVFASNGRGHTISEDVSRRRKGHTTLPPSDGDSNTRGAKTALEVARERYAKKNVQRMKEIET